MLCVLFTGCGSNGGESSGNPQESGNSQEAGEQSGSGAASGEKKDKITVAIYDRGTLDPSEGAMEDNRWTKWINENAPVEVEFIAIPRWGSSDKYSNLLASDSAPDLILEYDTGILQNMLSNDCLMPIGDLIDQYSVEYKALVDKYPMMRKLGTVDGELYYFTRTEAAKPNHVIYIRTDWLKKVNMEMPKTAEEFYAVAEAFAKQDPDGNGVDDTYGYSASFIGSNQISYMFCAGTKDIFIEKDNELTCSWENIAAATEFLKKMFDNGIINKDFATDSSGEQAIQDFISGKLGIIALNNGAAAISYGTLENFFENNPEATLEVLPMPSSEFGESNTVISCGSKVTGAINAKCKNPEAVIKYMDWLNSSQEIYDTLLYGGSEYAVQDENGYWTAKDADVSAKEVYGTDFVMAISTIDFNINPYAGIDTSGEMGARMVEFYQQACKAYIENEHAFVNLVRNMDPRPLLDSELSMRNSNTYTSSILSDNWTKAIISGDEYTVQDALEDNQKLVEEGGGSQVLEFYQNWYKDAKENDLLITEEDYKAFIQ